MSEVLPYVLRIAPGLVLIVACFLLSSRERDPWLRIVALILGFVLMRDAMTPAGFWSFGVSGGAPWLRFVDDPVLLGVFGATMLGVTGLVLWRVPHLASLVRWGRLDLVTVAAGVGVGLAVAAPFLVVASATPIEQRGGAVAASFLPVLLFFALAGNLGEEVLFRGFLQGRLEWDYSPARAALISGVAFAACHAFLASTVTDVGWPLLLFTLVEGLSCAYLRMWRGVAPAAIAHGVAIFAMASGVL